MKVSTPEPPLTNDFGIEFPGITIESQKAVLKLLDQNDKNFDIFFNEKGFHNHCVHHLLAAYSCGASPERLESIYQKSSSYQRPRHPPKVTITEDNWTKHLGNNDMWTDYLTFFENLINENGIEKTFNKYAFHPAVLPRLFSGALHPIIHTGNGLEFQIPLIVAEGLAQTAVHQNRLINLLSEEYWSYKGPREKMILEIISAVQEDPNLDHVISHSDDKKLQIVLNERVEVIRNHAATWKIQETEEGVHLAARELFEACAIAYGASAIRPNKKCLRLDFFLMHGLTSVYFIYMSLSHVDLKKRITLLRGHFAAVLTYYISRGRPNLNIESLSNYVPQKLQQEPNPWLDVIKQALLEEDESHVIKTVRSLLKAEQEFGPREDNLFLKIAQMTVEGYHKYGWSMNGVGFDEEWKEESVLEKVKGQVVGMFEKIDLS